MNQGKIWLVVKPTVGLPLFLGSVDAYLVARSLRRPEPHHVGLGLLEWLGQAGRDGCALIRDAAG